MKKNNVNQKKGAAHAGIGKIVLWIVFRKRYSGATM